MKKIKLIGMILGVIVFIMLISGITYAAYSWATDPNNGYISGDTECLDITYTKGTDILGGTLEFTSTYDGGLSATVKAKLKDNCTINGIGSLYLDTKNDTSDYLVNNNIIRYQVLEGTTEVSSGVVSSKGKNIIYDNFTVDNTEKEYTVYIWININDINNDNISDIMTSIYSGAIAMSVEGR